MLKVLLDLQTLQSESRHRGIGNYARGLADALTRRSDVEWHVLLSDAMPDTLQSALRWARGRMEPEHIHVLHGLAPTRGFVAENATRARAVEALYAGFTEALAVDLVHVASPFDGWGDETIMDLGSPERGTTFAATVYDLIPFEEPQLFLPTPLIAEWYGRRFDSLTQVDTALAISEHTRSVVRARLGLAEEAIVNIGADVDPVFASQQLSPVAGQALTRRYGITRPFLVHVGILEPRKNTARLIEAFAALPEAIRASHQIVLVTKVTDAQRESVSALVRALGLPGDAVVLPGFVPDADLAALYGLAEVTVMPSLNEGFGLPLLEAMRCGCPVLGSATTSIPEVIGRSDLTFDPISVPAITASLARMLTDADFRMGARAHAAVQQALFSWDKSAARACEAFADAVARRRAAARPRRPAPSLDLSMLAEGRYYLPLAACLEPNALLEPLPVTSETALRENLVAQGPALLIALDSESPPDGVATGVDQSRGGIFAPPGLVATLRPDGEERTSVTLTWHSWPRTGGARPPQPSLTPAAALAEVLATHPLGCAGTPLARLRQLAEATPPVPAFDLARALSDNHAPATPRPRLLVDITELARHDARSGIQRVVRNILAALLDEPGDFEVLAIRRDAAEHRYARTFTAHFRDEPLQGSDAPVDFRPGDTVLGLDFDATIPPSAVENLQRQHLRGVRFVHVLYDTLPLHRPDWFGGGMGALYTQWLHVLAELSDGIACISRAVSDDLDKVFAERRILADRSVLLGAFHLGADLDTGMRVIPEVTDARHTVIPQSPDHLFEPDVPVFLTVGTLEPRKGHAQLLDAAEILWAKGSPVIVAIAGKRGWLVDALIQRIENHPELGRRLRWFEAADDSVLQQIYRQATVALLPSEGEGFGLPLVEAAHVGLPILARDLPVFREIGGTHATYFGGFDGPALARAMEDWLEEHAAGRAPASTGIAPLTWAESARQLLAFLHTVPHQP